MLTSDLLALEEILLLNASFSYVESITILDANYKTLLKALKTKQGSRIVYEISQQKPMVLDQPLVVDEVAGSERKELAFWVLPHKDLMIWHQIGDGSAVGYVGVEYSLDLLKETTASLLVITFLAVGFTSILVMVLLWLWMRVPMRFLQEITAFATVSEIRSGRQLPVYQKTHEIYELSRALNQFSIMIRSHERNLLDRMAQNQAILENLADGIVVTESNGEIRSCNFALTKIFGYEAIELVGKNISILMPEPIAGQHDGHMANYGRTGSSKIIGVGREVEAKRKDGTVFPADLAISKCRDRDDTIFIGVLRDISERRKLDRLKSEFVSTVSHELRTPLTSIHGSLKLVVAGVTGELNPEAKKMVGLAQKNSERLILLINDLLDMEKLVAGKMEMKISRVDIVSVLNQSVADNTAYADKYEVTLRLQSLPDAAHVSGDPARIAQVLANLFSNAAKFSGQSKVVDVRAIFNSDSTIIEVEDHGDGIAEDFKDKIFSAFAQASSGNTRQQGGTGLGLKISKVLVEAMGGEIGFRTQQGVGTVFWFSLKNA
ncbi:PAS domain S-box protein [Undibacterium sp. Di24W]